MVIMTKWYIRNARHVNSEINGYSLLLQRCGDGKALWMELSIRGKSKIGRKQPLNSWRKI